MKNWILMMALFAILPLSMNAQKTLCPDGQHPHAVDLGLPSGTKWSCMNVGATTPEDWGGLYTWGECETKQSYTKETNRHYRNGDFVNIGNDISRSENDAAHVCWGGDWHMPTNKQVKELLTHTTHKTIVVDGVSGCEFRGKNGKTIFLPFSGVIGNQNIQRRQSAGYYWTSQQHPEYKGSAYIISLDGNKVSLDSNGRNWGHSIRPVKSR